MTETLAEKRKEAFSRFYEELMPVLVESLFKRSQAIRALAMGGDDPEGLNNLAAFYRLSGKSTESEQFSKQSLALMEKRNVTYSFLVTDALENLALLYSDQGRYVEAEEMFKKWQSLSESYSGKDSVELAQIDSNLALLYRKTERKGEADEMDKQAARIRAKYPNGRYISILNRSVSE